jgi:Restriction endonuclease
MICSTCKKDQDVQCFSKDKRRPLGIRSRCKACVRLDNTKYRKRNLISEKKRIADYKKLKKHHINALNSKRRTNKYGNGGKHTAQEWLDKMTAYNNICAICKLAKPLTKDHIIPLSKGGTDNIDNIQPLCQTCNSKKGNRL